MIEKIEQICKKYKDRVAYIVNDEYITYDELWKQARALANSLRNQGSSPVIIYGHKSINMIVSIVACLLSKRAYIPIDLHIPLERIEEIIKLTNSNLIIKNENIEIQSVEALRTNEIIEKYNLF